MVLRHERLPVVKGFVVRAMRRVAGVAALGASALLFLPAERVPIPADYGGSADGAVVNASIDGPSLYAEQCSACHGFSGEGGRGPKLAGRISAADTKRATRQVTNGGVTMPAFRAKLRTAEVASIIAYVQSLQDG